MPSRLNNRKTGAMIAVMQRVHEGDLSGAFCVCLQVPHPS
jgi:hypothetical protein